MNLRLGSDFARNCPGLVLGFTDWVIRLREGVKNWKWPRNKKGLSSGVVIKKGISHNGLFLLPLLSAQCDVLLTFSLANTPYFICVHVICWDRLRCIIYLNNRGSSHARFWNLNKIQWIVIQSSYDHAVSPVWPISSIQKWHLKYRNVEFRVFCFN